MKKGQSFRPSEVIQWIFPEAWVHFIPEILSEIERLQKEGKIEVLQDGTSPEYPLKNEQGIIISLII